MADLIEVAVRHDAAFDAQDPEARMASETPDIESVLPGGITLRGSEQVVALLRVFWEALPDAKIAHQSHIAAGDTVVTEGTLSGTHSGAFRSPEGDIAASGNGVTLRYASVKRIRDGRVFSEHLYFDQLEFLQQLGALPPGRGR